MFVAAESRNPTIPSEFGNPPTVAANASSALKTAWEVQITKICRMNQQIWTSARKTRIMWRIRICR